MTGFESTIHATSALHAKDYIFNVAKLIPHFCSAVKKDKAAYGTNVAKYTINSIGEAIDILEKFYHILDDIDKYKRENKKGDLLEIVIDILNIIFGVMDHVVTIMELEEAEYLQNNAGSISVRDALRLTLMTQKIVLSNITFMHLLLKTSPFYHGKIECSGEKLKVVFQDIEEVSTYCNRSKSAIAGNLFLE